MSKLLSITIPTCNRADLLHTQLAWLAKEIKGFEDECEILVYDNCSTDHTLDVAARWQVELGTALTVVKNPENIGGMRNLARSLAESTGKFTWTVGDDDPINDGALAFLVKTLKTHPDLALVYLNCSGYYKPTDHVFAEHYFPTDFPQVPVDGKWAYQRCIEDNIGGVMFLTSTVYRTELAQTALSLWPDSVKNWAGQAFWTGYCAAQGNILVTKDNYLVCIVGVSQWQGDSKISTRIPAKDVPEVCYQLQKVGYPHTLSRRVISKNFSDFFNIYVKQDGPKAYLRPLKEWPVSCAAAFLFMFGSLCASALERTTMRQPLESSDTATMPYRVAQPRHR